jgi:hypothetical protein
MWRKTVVLKDPIVIDYLKNKVAWGQRDKFIEVALIEKITNQYKNLTKEDIINTINEAITACGKIAIQKEQTCQLNEDSILSVLNGEIP